MNDLGWPWRVIIHSWFKTRTIFILYFTYLLYLFGLFLWRPKNKQMSVFLYCSLINLFCSILFCYHSWWIKDYQNRKHDVANDNGNGLVLYKNFNSPKAAQTHIEYKSKLKNTLWSQYDVIAIRWSQKLSGLCPLHFFCRFRHNWPSVLYQVLN